MPEATSSIPAELVDLALDALDAEVKCWRRVPWAPGHIRLMRCPPMDFSPGAAMAAADEVITFHDVPADSADDIIVRLAMEKVIEAVIGAISVAPAAPSALKRRRSRKKAA